MNEPTRAALRIGLTAAAAVGAHFAEGVCRAHGLPGLPEALLGLPVADASATVLALASELGVHHLHHLWTERQQEIRVQRGWVENEHLAAVIADVIAELVTDWGGEHGRLREAKQMAAVATREWRLISRQLGDPALHAEALPAGLLADPSLPIEQRPDKEEDWRALAGRLAQQYERSGGATRTTHLLTAEELNDLARSMRAGFFGQVQRVICKDEHRTAYRKALVLMFGEGFRDLARRLTELRSGQDDLGRAIRRAEERLAALRGGQDELAGDLRRIERELVVGLPGMSEKLDRVLRTERDSLGLYLPAAEGRAPYLFSTELVEFRERAKELATLLRFCAADPRRPFLWFRVSGPAGTGKSRLALQFCRELREIGWEAKFLDLKGPADLARWNPWRPEAPTFVVVDYALDHEQRTSALLTTLARRAADGRFECPVRFLLLAREERGARWRSVAGDEASADAAARRGALWASPAWESRDDGAGRTAAFRALASSAATQDDESTSLPLTPLSKMAAGAMARDLWQGLSEAEVAMRPEEEREAALPAALDALDEARIAGIPLFTQFAARRIADPEADLTRPYTAADLSREILDREFGRWQESALPNGYTNLPFLSTILGELHADAASWPGLAQIPAYRELHLGVCDGVYSLSRGVDHARRILPRLEPDVLGEWYVLRRLTESAFMGRPAAQEEAVALLKWCLEPEAPARQSAALAFLVRAQDSFPGESERAGLPDYLDDPNALILHSLAVEGRSNSGAVPSEQDFRTGSGLARNVQDGPAREVWLSVLVNVTARHRDSPALGELHALRRAFPDDCAVRESLARGLFNAFNNTRGVDPQHAYALLDELRSLTRAFPNDAAVRVPFAMGLVNTIALNPPNAGVLLDELRTLGRTFADDTAVRERLARGLFSAFENAATADPRRTQDLLNELRALGRSFPDDTAVREHYAKGLFNAFNRDSTVDLQRAQHLLDELRALARAFPDDPGIRRPLAMGLLNAFNAVGEVDPKRAQHLLNELRVLAGAFPDDVAAREQLANGLFNAFVDASETDPQQAHGLLNDLRALAGAFPDDAAVREQLANGLFNASVDAVEADPQQAQALLDELRALHRAFPDDTAVIEPLGAAFLVISLASGDRADALAWFCEFVRLGLGPSVARLDQVRQAFAAVLRRWKFTDEDLRSCSSSPD